MSKTNREQMRNAYIKKSNPIAQALLETKMRYMMGTLTDREKMVMQITIAYMQV